MVMDVVVIVIVVVIVVITIVVAVGVAVDVGGCSCWCFVYYLLNVVEVVIPYWMPMVYQVHHELATQWVWTAGLLSDRCFASWLS